jgi:putative ATP-dependent endonuclease of OLD family
LPSARPDGLNSVIPFFETLAFHKLIQVCTLKRICFLRKVHVGSQVINPKRLCPGLFLCRLTIKNYRNFGDPAFELSLKPFTLILGENNIGKTNLLNALCLLFGQEISISQSRVLQLDDLNYEAVTRFRKQVADLSVSHDQVVFPEVEVTVLLANMNEDQEAVVGDWFSDTELTEALVTYRFSLRASFDREKWIAQQRAVLNSIPTKPTPVLVAVEGDSVQPSMLAEQAPQTPAIWKRVEFPIGDYRYLIYGGGKKAAR